MSSTEQFYWPLKLPWPNKQPGKTPLLLELTLFPRMQTGSASDRVGDRERKDRRRVRGEGVGAVLVTFIPCMHVHTFAHDFCIYGVNIVANSYQKPVFPIHRLIDHNNRKMHRKYSRFCWLVRRCRKMAFVLLLHNLNCYISTRRWGPTRAVVTEDE